MNSLALQFADTAGKAEESDVLSRARAGDAEAVDLLVRMHLKDVYALAWRLIGDRELAEDAAQDAIVSAIKGLHRFRGEASFRTWLLRIALNSARSVARRRTRRKEVSLEVVAERAGGDDDVANQVARRDEAARAARLLEKLPEKQRMAVSLRIHEGLSYQEIGALLDCSEGAARVNYHLGVKRLRELMK